MAKRVIGTAQVNVEADTSAFRRGLDGATSHIGSAFGKIKGVIAGLGLTQIGKEAIDFGSTYRKQLDDAAAAVKGLTSSQSEADTLMKKMTDFAINTPFDLPGVQAATTRVLAFGDAFGIAKGHAADALDIVKVIGDAAAISGKGSDAMLNAITAMGKISGQGKATSRDFNQLTANFPALKPWQVLADLSGKTEAQLRDLAKKPGGLSGLVEPQVLIDALIKKMGELPGAANAMERKMQTLGGTMELFKDTMGVALAGGLQPFFGALQGLLKNPAIQQGLAKLATAFGTILGAVMDKLAPVLPQLVDSFILMLNAVMPLTPVVADLAQVLGLAFVQLAPVIELLSKFVAVAAELIMKLPPELLGTLAAAFIILWLAVEGPIGPIILGITALIAVFVTVFNKLGGFSQLAKDIGTAWNWLFDHVFQPVGEWVMKIVHWFQDLYDKLVGHSIIPDLVNGIIHWFQILGQVIEVIVNAIRTVVTTVWNAIKTAVTVVVEAIATVIKFYFNVYWTIISTAINIIRDGIEIVWNGIKTMSSTVWNGIKTVIGGIVDLIKDRVINPFKTALSVVQVVWEQIKTAITTPIQAAYNFVKGIVDKIAGLVKGAVDAIHSIPGAGIVGGAVSAIGGLFHADGGVFNQPHFGVVAERGPEAIIPMRNPMRAMQVMQQAGLDRLAANMGSGRGFGGPLITMPGAIIQDATDADLVAQRTLVAMQAAMIA